MITYKKSLTILKKNIIKLKSENIYSQNSFNRICSKKIHSPNNHPAANNSAFDGYAINSNETIGLSKKKIRKFKIIKTIAAGDNPAIKKILKFSTIEVMTG